MRVVGSHDLAPRASEPFDEGEVCCRIYQVAIRPGFEIRGTYALVDVISDADEQAAAFPRRLLQGVRRHVGQCRSSDTYDRPSSASVHPRRLSIR
jgi:hypothetical protein